MLPLPDLPPFRDQLDCTDRGVPRTNLANVVRVLQLDPKWGPERLWFDEFLDKICVANSPTRAWTDEDDYRLTVYLQETIGMSTVADSIVAKGVQLVAKLPERRRHLVRDRLDTLVWDGIPRIDLAFEELWGADRQPPEYVRAASRNFFVGLAARIFRPGCKLDTMPVFEGKQGIKKSSALMVLGGEHYAVISEAVSSKDFLQSLRGGKWILEISELQSFSRADVAHVKSMMSTQVDHYRPSYGRATLDYPRQCVFAGTTNTDDWGTDETGLRRFWPITCGEIHLDLLQDARDQLFAEAVHAFHAGATWWEMPETTLAEQADRQADHPWTDLVREGLLHQAETTVLDVLQRLIKFEPHQITMAATRDVGRILKLMGWTKHNVRRSGKQSKTWVAPHVDG